MDEVHGRGAIGLTSPDGWNDPYLLKLGEAGAAGNCPACGALQARGAVFCWQCSNELKPAATPEQPKPAPSAEQPKPAPSAEQPKAPPSAEQPKAPPSA